MSRLNFTFTKNAVELLVNMARSSMFEDLNPEKAVKIITDVLIGCDRNAALQIIKGMLVVDIDEDGTVFASKAKRDDTIIGIRATVGGIANRCCDDIDNAICLIRGISYMIKDECISIDIPWLSLVDSLMDDKLKLSLKDINISGGNYDTISTVIAEAKRVKDQTVKVIGLARFVNDNYELFEDRVDDSLFEKLNVGIENLEKTISNPSSTESLVSEYIKREKEINKALDRFLSPCDITKGYDAGWLAPNGDFYGLFGTEGNLLHIRISDKLKSQGTISYDTGDNPDYWMESNGWMRIYGKNVFFNHANIFEERYNSVTKEQVEKLILYGNSCFNGWLSFGYNGKLVSMNTLMATDLLMINQLFDDRLR